MPGGERRLCFLASLLLCDEIILTQRGKGVEGQRSKNFTIAVMGVMRLGEKLGEKAREFCGCRGRNGIILRKD